MFFFGFNIITRTSSETYPNVNPVVYWYVRRYLVNRGKGKGKVPSV